MRRRRVSAGPKRLWRFRGRGRLFRSSLYSMPVAGQHRICQRVQRVAYGTSISSIPSPGTSAITCTLILRSSHYPGSRRNLVHQDRVVAEVGNEGFGDLGYRLVRASGRPVSDADQRSTTQVQGSLQGPSSPIGCPGIVRDTCLRPGILRHIGRCFTVGLLGSQESADPAHG